MFLFSCSQTTSAILRLQSPPCGDFNLPQVFLCSRLSSACLYIICRSVDGHRSTEQPSWQSIWGTSLLAVRTSGSTQSWFPTVLSHFSPFFSHSLQYFILCCQPLLFLAVPSTFPFLVFLPFLWKVSKEVTSDAAQYNLPLLVQIPALLKLLARVLLTFIGPEFHFLYLSLSYNMTTIRVLGTLPGSLCSYLLNREVNTFFTRREKTCKLVTLIPK